MNVKGLGAFWNLLGSMSEIQLPVFMLHQALATQYSETYLPLRRGFEPNQMGPGPSLLPPHQPFHQPSHVLLLCSSGLLLAYTCPLAPRSSSPPSPPPAAAC